MRSTHLTFSLIAFAGSLAVVACGDDEPSKSTTPEPDASTGGEESGGGGGSGGGSGGRMMGSGGRMMGSGGMMNNGGGGMAMDAGMDAMDAMSAMDAMDAMHHQHDAGATCGRIVTACHPVDPNEDGNPITDCHGIGHAGEAEACEENLDECTDTCGTELCKTIASTCHGVGEPDGGPLADCHEIGHSGDPDTCIDNADCVHMCEEAAGDGGAHEDPCERIVTACHHVDPAEDGNPITDCHGIGHADDHQACMDNLESCEETCGTPLCAAIASACHGVSEPDGGPLTDCHEIGHAGDTDACIDNVMCLQMCQEAASDAGGDMHMHDGGTDASQ